MADVITTARRFRANARRRGNPARALLARRYAAVVAGVRADTAVVERQVKALRRNGVEPSEQLLRSLDSMRALKLRTERRLLTAADSVFGLLDRETSREVLASMRDARQLAAMGTGTFEELLNEVAVMNLVGNTDRGPLQRLLRERAGSDAEKVAQLLTEGLLLDRPAAQTAQAISDHIAGSSQASALRLVRTETHRARREAARVMYLNVPDCRGWVWVCSLTPTSCGLCWAKHGQVFGLDEPMGTHPNCTCELAPWFGEEHLTGVDLFDALTADEQDTALGASTGRAYRAGALSLEDLAGQRRDPAWGPVGAQRSLVAVLGDDARQYYRP